MYYWRCPSCGHTVFAMGREWGEGHEALVEAHERTEHQYEMNMRQIYKAKGVRLPNRLPGLYYLRP